MVAAAGSRRGPDGGPFALDVDYSITLTLARLPRGRHGLPREFVDLNHRNRLLAGAIESVAERGYLATTVAHLTSAAGVSRGAFYRHFDDKQECFLLAYDVIVDWVEEQIRRALEPCENWSQGVQAALARALEIFAADSRLARFCTLEILLAGAPGLARYGATVERLAAPLRAGRAERTLGAGLSPHFEQALLGGAISLIAGYVAAGKAERLSELAPELNEFLLGPYLGVAPAREVAVGA